MRPIPFFRQLNRDYCGPAILKMILGAYGIYASQHELAKEAKTPRDPHHGTTTTNLVGVLKKRGFIIRAGNHKNISLIKKALQKGSIVIICYTEPILEWGHYAIVREIKDGKIFLLDPDARTGKTVLFIDEFQRRWKDPIFTNTVKWAAFVDGLKKKSTN